MAVLDCNGKTTREINQEISELIANGAKTIEVCWPLARHNLAVGLLQPVELLFKGSVGYYCGGMMDGARITIEGSAGWGLGECMMSGSVVVRGNAGNSAAASIRGGTVVIHGDAGARAGIAMKGGLLIIEGNCGAMSGFMMQKGTMIICGSSGHGLADSMYEGTVFLGGEAASLGNDTKVCDPNEGERRFLKDTLSEHGIAAGRSFKKIVAGRRLWNFEKQEFDLWKEVL
jgi:methylamine---glutamate N-methyltransferase subunit B